MCLRLIKCQFQTPIHENNNKTYKSGKLPLIPWHLPCMNITPWLDKRTINVIKDCDEKIDEICFGQKQF